MSRGRREEIFEKKLNMKKVVFAIIIVLFIVAGIFVGINKDKIFDMLNQEKEEYNAEKIEPQEKEKTIEEILAEFGGEVLEQPKSDTYFVSKEGKEYTVYADGEIIEEKVNFWNGKSSKPTIDEDAKIITISLPEELKWVADQVINGKENFKDITINVQKHLDFGARIKDDGTWEGPIWTSIIGFLDELPKEDEEKKEESNEEIIDTEKENLKRFAGHFNGNGFSIRGICIESEKDYQGLFGFSTGTIENVVLKNSYISGNTSVGAIVGLNGGTVKNCITKNTIVQGKENKIGGIVGVSMSGSTILQAYTEKGSVNGKQYVAGIAGYVNNNTTITDCSSGAKITGEDYLGGIVGIAFFGTTIQGCNNHSKVNGKNYVGGIAGYSQAQLEKTYNTAEVFGEDYIAGLVGVNYTMGDVSKSYNSGNIIGNNNVGGIVGTNNASTSNCYNVGNIKGKGYRTGGICGQNSTESYIYNCYNIGKIEGNDSIGGIAGGDFGTITNSYYLDVILKNVESEEGKTEEYLKNNMLESLGQEFLADINQKNQGYPILEWQM